MTDFEAMRREYSDGSLEQSQAGDDPMDLFKRWLDEAVRTNQGAWFEPNAMVLATADADGPDGRIVLLKDVDDRGLVFYTNYDSAKARQILADPRVAAVFYWSQLHRQVRIRGRIQRIDEATSRAYFASRPRGSQLGAIVSRQSEVIDGRQVLDQRLAEAQQQYEGREIPKPDNWGGYRIVPERVEFWQGRENRLHDRIRFLLADGHWRRQRLSP
jgi:pyridoxamine 5'-phosphate oxidase